MKENKILHDLDQGICPKEALDAYAYILGTGYLKLSCCKLAINLTTYYDDLEQAAGIHGEAIQQLFVQLQDVIVQLLEEKEEFSKEEILVQLLDMREQLTASLKNDYAYVHMLGVYEHIANRLQYKYDTTIESVDLEQLLRDVEHYICQDQDAAMINQRMQNILGDMPIRMTKSYFLSLVEKSCACYKGARSDMADSFFDDMYQQATLSKSSELNQPDDILVGILKKLEINDWKNLDEAGIKQALDLLQIAGERLGQSFAYGFQLLELLNDVMIICLNLSHFNCRHESIDLSYRCIKAYIRAANENDFIGMDENMIEDLEKIHEFQQQLTGMHMLMEDRLSGYRQQYRDLLKELGYQEIFDHLSISQILAGVNMMAELNISQEIFSVDAAYIKQKTDKLIEKYQFIFENYPMMIRRAVIADALTKLPLACDSIEDGLALIRQNFESCKDQAERYVCKEIIQHMMQDKEWQN